MPTCLFPCLYCCTPACLYLSLQARCLPRPSGYWRTHLLTGHAHTHTPGCGHIAAITTVQAPPTSRRGRVFTYAHHVTSLATPPVGTELNTG